MELIGAVSIAGQFNAGGAIVAGLAGGLAFLIVVTMGYSVGMTRMNFLYILGSMLAPKSPRSTVYAIGLGVHAMASAAFGLVHAGILHAIGVTSVGQAAGWDLLIGGVHGLLVLMVLPMALEMMHPLVRRGEIERPRIALTGFGAMTPIGSLAAHVAFGVVTGALYAAFVL
jgi:hypothetical protein